MDHGISLSILFVSNNELVDLVFGICIQQRSLSHTVFMDIDLFHNLLFVVSFSSYSLRILSRYCKTNNTKKWNDEEIPISRLRELEKDYPYCLH